LLRATIFPSFRRNLSSNSEKKEEEGAVGEYDRFQTTLALTLTLPCVVNDVRANVIEEDVDKVGLVHRVVNDVRANVVEEDVDKVGLVHRVVNDMRANVVEEDVDKVGLVHIVVNDVRANVIEEDVDK
jgi:hypothetical protein